MTTIHDEFLMDDYYVHVLYTNDVDDPYMFKVYDQDGEELIQIPQKLAIEIVQRIIDRDEERKHKWH